MNGMKRGVAIKRGFFVVLCHVRAMLYIRRGIYISRRADSEDEERDGQIRQVIVQGNHVRVTAFYLKSVTKAVALLTSYTEGKEREIERRNTREAGA